MLKKERPGLDTTDLSNYRMVSNATFMSKLVERAVAKLHRYVTENDLLRCYRATSLLSAGTTRQKLPYYVSSCLLLWQLLMHSKKLCLVKLCWSCRRRSTA